MKSNRGNPMIEYPSNEVKDDYIEKDSVTYFMTRMTQKEFEEKTNGKEKVDYKFNKIKRLK